MKNNLKNYTSPNKPKPLFIQNYFLKTYFLVFLFLAQTLTQYFTRNYIDIHHDFTVFLLQVKNENKVRIKTADNSIHIKYIKKNHSCLNTKHCCDSLLNFIVEIDRKSVV